MIFYRVFPAFLGGFEAVLGRFAVLKIPKNGVIWRF